MTKGASETMGQEISGAVDSCLLTEAVICASFSHNILSSYKSHKEDRIPDNEREITRAPKTEKVGAHALFGTKEFKYKTQYFQALLIRVHSLMDYSLLAEFWQFLGKKFFFFFKYVKHCFDLILFDLSLG